MSNSDESVLLRPRSSLEAQCCPEGNGSEPRRCLRVLLRNTANTYDREMAIRAACASVLGTTEQAFASLSGRAESECFSAGQNQLGIITEELEHRGWIGADENAVPRGFDAVPLPLNRNQLAIGSHGCDFPFGRATPNGWSEARNNCTTYESVDVFVGANAEGAGFARRLANWHPYNSRNLGDHVVTVAGDSVGELQSQLSRLAMQCKVINRMYWSGHGVLGALLVGDRAVSTTAILSRVLSPCLFKPGSQIQFGSCLQACGQVAESLRTGLERIYSRSQFQTASQPAPFEGLRLLFNADIGLEGENSFNRFFHGSRGTSRSLNNIGAQFTVHGTNLNSDIPTSTLPQCNGRGYNTQVSPELRRLLENPPL